LWSWLSRSKPKMSQYDDKLSREHGGYNSMYLSKIMLYDQTIGTIRRGYSTLPWVPLVLEVGATREYFGFAGGKPQMATLRGFISTLSSGKVRRASSSGVRHFILPRISPWTNLLMLTTFGPLLEAALSASQAMETPARFRRRRRIVLINSTKKTGFIAHNLWEITRPKTRGTLCLPKCLGSY
jgi:hypothetical protein